MIVIKVNKIKKKKSELYIIDIEDYGKVEVYEESIIKHNILYKKEIDIDLIKILEIEANDSGAYFKALNYISYRQRSIKEIKDYLKKKEVSKKTITTVVERLLNEGYLNDTSFSKSYTADKINLTKWGPLKIKKELEKLVKDKNIIDDVIDEVDNEIIVEKASRIVIKQSKINRKYSSGELKNRLYTNLFNLGYSKEVIEIALQNLEKQDDSLLLEKEYSKVYNKLSKKYNGKELDLKIKSTLFKKGFEVNEIDKKIGERD